MYYFPCPRRYTSKLVRGGCQQINPSRERPPFLQGQPQFQQGPTKLLRPPVATQPPAQIPPLPEKSGRPTSACDLTTRGKGEVVKREVMLVKKARVGSNGNK